MKVIRNMTIIKYELFVDFISVTHFYFLLHWAKLGLDKSMENYVRVWHVRKG